MYISVILDSQVGEQVWTSTHPWSGIDLAAGKLRFEWTALVCR